MQRITLIDAPAVLGAEPEGPPGEKAGHLGVRDFVAAGMKAGAITKLDADSLAHVLRGSILQGAMVSRTRPTRPRHAGASVQSSKR